ncbi:MAG: hypothetical protein M1827_000562 [Pycnora praestabilis]|nr:MAG: hypothetical protein M1827_000562 [Pycnora praestabilis]
MEVEELVKRLYLPESPVLIGKIQSVLHNLQRSPEGWQLADALLGSHDDKVRFFGALTFTVKLNADWDSLDQENVQPLLYRLISWLVRLSSQDEGPLVVRKLCSALVAYFLRPNVSWEKCIRHLICSFCNGEAILLESMGQYPATPDLVPRLSHPQAAAAFWFSSTLVEEVGKISSGSIAKVQPNVDDAVALIHQALDSVIRSGSGVRRCDEKLSEEGLKCFQSWVFYSHRAWIDTSLELEPLRALTQPAIQCLMIDQMFEVAVELFTDVLNNYPKFFSDEDTRTLLSVLSGPWAEERLARLTGGDFDFDSVQLGRMLLAFGDAIVQDLARTPNYAQQLMRMLHGLLTCDGLAVAEDEICVPALEFWNTFVEFMTDTLFAEGDEVGPWMGSARDNVIQAIEECWAKIRLPPYETVASWDSEVRKGFKDFRTDVSDLLQSSYTLLGVGIFEKFVNLAIRSFDNRSWADIEATLFCLSALADCLAEEETEDRITARLFRCPMFAYLSNADASIPANTRQTAVTMIGQYASFFERHTEYLPSALNFLFISLEAPALATTASKSISSLCSSCRSSLISEIGAFLRQYDRFLAWPTAETFTKERLIGAIAAIVQALPSDEAKVEPLQHLLDFIEQDVGICISCISAGQYEDAQIAGVTALRCLTGMGKALQVPDDVPIEVDADTTKTSLWDNGAGLSVQARIIKNIRRVLEALRHDGEIMEAACLAFRAGFTETLPGPFVFAPQVITDFILGTELDTPRLGVILSTACVLITTHATDSSTRVDYEAHALLRHVLKLIDQLEDPTKDMEVAQNCIDFVGKLIPRYLNVLLSIEPQHELQSMFLFTIKCLRGNDILPKRAAASFWSLFVVTTNENPRIQSSIDSIMQELGPILAAALVKNIGGDAARSELDMIAEPLKKLVFKQQRAKSWLEAALTADTFPSQKVDATEKRVWLQKVLK